MLGDEICLLHDPSQPSWRMPLATWTEPDWRNLRTRIKRIWRRDVTAAVERRLSEFPSLWGVEPDWIAYAVSIVRVVLIDEPLLSLSVKLVADRFDETVDAVAEFLVGCLKRQRAAITP